MPGRAVERAIRRGVDGGVTMSGSDGAARRAASAVIVATLVAAVVSSGCIPGRAISTRAVDYNVAAEQARSEMLLLNVLRARDRKPMVFTGLTRISGSLRGSAGIGASAQAGPDRAKAQNFSTSVDFSDAPSFDVAVLDSQEFTRGIMTPLRFDILEYFWDQGFNRELLLYLVVERVELRCGGPDAELRLLENDPTSETFDDFRAVVAAAADSGRWEADLHQVETAGPPVDAASVTNPGTLMQIAGSGWKLRPLPEGTYLLERPTAMRRLFIPAATICGKSAGAGDARLYDSKDTFETAGRRGAKEIGGRFVLRSPQSVLYYLGELVRPGGERVAIRPRSSSSTESSRRLFVIREAGDCPGAEVRVQYSGATHAIPRGEGDCDPGRSMQVLAFAAQLLALQQSSRDLPAAGTLRVVGQ